MPTSSRLSLLLAVSIATLASPALADAVRPGPDCPEGSEPRSSHSGARCVLSSCDECRGTEVCVRRRVCTLTMEVQPGGRGARRAAPFREEQVVGICDEGASCAADPAIPTVGEATGEVRCRDRDVCAARPLLPFPPMEEEVVPTAPPPEPSAPAPPAAAPLPPAPVVVSAPAPQEAPAGCTACAASSGESGSRGSAFVLVLVLAALARRRGAPVGVVAMFLSLGLASSVQAQPAERTAAGWAVVRGAAGLVPSRIACSGEEAFVLSEHFVRLMDDGSRVETLARIRAFSPAAGVRELPSPPEGTTGSLIAATPDGELFVGLHVEDHDEIGLLAEGRWEVLPIVDASGAPYPMRVADLLAFDALHAYAVGTGAIARREGPRFVAYSAGTHHPLFDIVGRSPRDMWIAGAHGTLLHWDGRAFHAEAAPDGSRGLVMLPRDGALWAGTDDGVHVRGPSGWALFTREIRPHVLVETRRGVYAIDDQRLFSLRGNVPVEEIGGWPLLGACTTSSALVALARGHEDWGGSRPEIHEPGDLLHLGL